MKKHLDLSIIIVHYNTPGLLAACLGRIAKSRPEGISVEVVVVDNGSTKENIQAVEATVSHVSKRLRIEVLKNQENQGFAKANNQGIARSSGRYVLLLNSDTEVHPDVLPHAVEYMNAHSQYAAYTPKLVLTDGSIDPACHRGFPTPWAALTYFSGLEHVFGRFRLFGEYHQVYKGFDTIHEIDCLSGAFFLLRSETIDRVGKLDEQFFMYGEDIDWCYRIRQSGGRIVYDPTYTVLHKKKRSGRDQGDADLRRQTQRYFYETMRQFYMKHYEEKYPWIVNQLVHAAIQIRIGLL